MKLALVPYPQRLRRLPGSCILRGRAVRVHRVDRLSAAVRHKLSALGLAARGDATVPPLSLVLGRTDPRSVRPPPHAEGYTLRCDAHGLVIAAADADGLFWALVTLQQLLGRSRGIPCVLIRDWPAFGFRYHHDDISRKQVSTVSDFQRIIRLLSSYKINYYTPYIEDMLHLPSHPDIGRGRGRLSAGEVRRILATARLHNVTVFPTYSLIGHQENLLARRKYRRYAQEVFQAPSSFDPSKPILRPFLRPIIADVCRLFPDAPCFHAGFDETQGVAKGPYIAHANWCAAEIARHGKKMFMWADMFKSHFGLGALRRLSANIVPVEWQYEDPRDIEAAYRRAKVKPLGLGSYKTWCAFLPDFRVARGNLGRWAGVARRLGLPGFGGSMWGDFGYENSRDLCWNLYAWLGETTWTARRAEPRDFERRFQSTFYGRPVPAVADIILKLSPRRRITPGQAWQWFRYPFTGCVRLVANNPTLAAKARHDLALYRRMMILLARARRQVAGEKTHLDHFLVAIEREILLVKRLLLAQQFLRSPRIPRALAAHLREIRRVGALYQRVWLRHNKRPNIEVSLAVFDQVATSIRSLSDRPGPARRYRQLPLDFDAYHADAGGVPIGRAEVHGIPFLFSGPRFAHRLVTADRPLPLDFAPALLRDLHLIYGCTTRDKSRPRPALEVSFLFQGNVIFRERLLSVRHLCEWSDPLGAWIWFGGGYRHVDRSRNRYALSPGPLHGLMHLFGFPLPRRVVADQLVFRGLGLDPFHLFAVTLETVAAALSIRPNPGTISARRGGGA